MRRLLPILLIGSVGLALAHPQRVNAQSWEPPREGSEPPIRIEEYGSFRDRDNAPSYEGRYFAARSPEGLAPPNSGASRSRIDLAYNTGTGLPPVQLDPNCAYPIIGPPPVVYPPVAPIIQPAPPLIAYASAPVFAGPGFYASADALWLERSNTDFVISSFREASATPGQPALSSDDFDFDGELGPRVTFGYLLATGNAIEGTYFGFYDWDETAFVVDVAEQIDLRAFSGGTSYDDFSMALQHTGVWTSELHSAELNFRLAMTQIASAIFGFRYVRVEEDFVLRSVDDLNPASDIGVYTVGTSNNLFGIQVGGDVDVLQMNRLSVSVNGAAGFFLNYQKNNFQVVDDNLLKINGQAREEELASLIEGGVRIRYRVVDSLFVHGGYDVIMINGVALAAQQVPNAIVSNSIFYHGPSAGVTWRR